MSDYRTERDSMGEVQVALEKTGLSREELEALLDPARLAAGNT